MKTTLALAAVMLAATATQAAEKTTEYFHRSGAGKQEATVGYSMETNATTLESTGSSVDNSSSTSDFVLKYEYGLDSNSSVGVKTFFGSEKTNESSQSGTASGMGDIHGFWEGQSDMWFYGVDVGLGLEKRKIDKDTTLQTNRASGGHSVTLHAGVEMGDSGLNYGADFSYFHSMERSADDDANTKISGLNAKKLAGFLETQMAGATVGGELSYTMISNATVKSDGATDTIVKGENFMGLRAYGAWDFDASITGLASLGMNMHPSHDYVDVAGSPEKKGYNETEVALGARFGF